MIILSNVFQFHNFTLLLLHYLKFFGNISDSFEFLKFQTFECENVKIMAKDKKVKSQ
jgi:hypothetical protein